MNRKPSLEDDDVVRALHAYQAALEAEERPDRADLLARFPALADELADVLDGLEFVNRVAPQLHPGGLAADDVHESVPVGDFRILREVGRGGMGVVYEAEQMSLGRRVALKVLPFAAVLDPRYLQRFRNEAQAAAQLHHTGIVPVHAVGNDRGVYYYAMQFIDGPTVAELIDELRDLRDDGVRRDASPALDVIARDRTTESPGFCRAVAELGVQAAEALDYAHESGVIHRDIKPPNLIVDARAHVWITDFGLASTRNDTGLTMTGDMLGTLRYMSPEQAKATRAPVDHRTDIYSLGVTLYELLTLEPAVPGGDAAAVAQAISSRDPVRPRALNPATPAELETILRKAMAKDPGDRYASAGAFAKDLRRFLEDRPIEARRPSPLKRAAQWARRHRAVVAAGVAALVIGLVALSISTVLLTRKQTRLAAEHARAEANLEDSRALVDYVLTRVAEELEDQPGLQVLRRELLEKALAHYRGFLQQKGDAPAMRYETAAAYLRVYDIETLLGQPEAAREAADAARELYVSLSAEFPKDAKYRDGLVCAWSNLGSALAGTGRFDEAEDAYEQALSELQDLGRIAGPAPAHLLLDARIRSSLGALLESVGRRAESRASLERARVVWQRLVDGSATREYRTGLADTLLQLAQQFELPAEFAAAEAMMGRYLDIVRELMAERSTTGLRLQEANGSWVLGNLYCAVRRHLDAIKAYRDALAVYDELGNDFPSVPEYADRLGKMFGNLAGVYRDMGDNGKRLEALESAQAVYADLVENHGDVPAFRHQLARACFRMSQTRAETGDIVGARRDGAAALEVFAAFENDEVDALYRFERPAACFHMARLLWCPPANSAPVGPDELRRAEECLLQGLALVEALIDDPNEIREKGDVEQRGHVEACLNQLVPMAWHLAMVRERAGKDGDAADAYRMAIRYSARLTNMVPDMARIRVGHADLHMALGRTLVRLGRTREAAEAFRKASEVAPEKTANLNEVAWFLANADAPARDAAEAVEIARRAVTQTAEPDPGLLNTLGVALYRAGEWKDAAAVLERSLAVKESPSRGWDLVFLAMARRKLGDGKAARAAYDEVVAWAAQHAPNDAELAGFLAEAEAVLGAD